MIPKKEDVIHAFQAQLRSRLESVEQITASARDEATNDETRSEGKYDTRAIEASYLAAGQGQRMAALRQLLVWFDQFNFTDSEVVGIGALVQIKSGTILLVGPVGGEQITIAGKKVTLLGARSPLGQALIGCEIDDEIAWPTPRGVRTETIVHVN